MKTKLSYLIDDFYFIANLLNDEVECIADFLKAKKLSKKKRSVLIIHMEKLSLKHIEDELESLLEFKINDIKHFANIWKMQKLAEENEEKRYQSSIFDFL